MCENSVCTLSSVLTSKVFSGSHLPPWWIRWWEDVKPPGMDRTWCLAPTQLHMPVLLIFALGQVTGSRKGGWLGGGGYGRTEEASCPACSPPLSQALSSVVPAWCAEHHQGLMNVVEWMNEWGWMNSTNNGSLFLHSLLLLVSITFWHLVTWDKEGQGDSLPTDRKPRCHPLTLLGTDSHPFLVFCPVEGGRGAKKESHKSLGSTFFYLTTSLMPQSPLPAPSLLPSSPHPGASHTCIAFQLRTLQLLVFWHPETSPQLPPVQWVGRRDCFQSLMK